MSQVALRHSPNHRSRRLRLLVGTVTAAAFALIGPPAASAADTSQSTVSLSATQTGDPDGSGSIDLSFDISTGDVCSTLTTAGIATPTAAHIHSGVDGSTGPIVVTLNTTTGCSDNDPAVVNSIVDAPADFYVNVHNADYPNGAIRGQVAATADSSIESTRFALLASGDTDGSGSVDLVFDAAANEVCFDLTVVTDETVTLAHIHEGAAGVDGPVVVDFNYPANGDSGCVTDETAGQITDILADPADYYVNVHTDANPAGAVRNQIVPTTPQQISTTALDGLGFGDPDGTGEATFTFYDNGDVCYRLTVTNIGDPTAAHIHTGADGVQGPVLIGLPIGETGLSGCTSSSEANVDAILANPTGFYVNVHNADYPNGAIRSQLAAMTAATTTEFDVALAPSGDSDGSGTAMLDIDAATGRVCFELATSNTATVTVAHIHSGGIGQDGPVVVDFDVPTNGLSGCVFGDAEITSAIVANPGAFYVNVHTTEYPNGAVRAQVNAAPPAATTTSTPTTIAPRLPETGTDNGSMALVAVALLGLGGTLVVATRRRSGAT